MTKQWFWFEIFGDKDEKRERTLQIWWEVVPHLVCGSRWSTAVGPFDGFCVFSCWLPQTEALHHQPSSSLLLFTSVYSCWGFCHDALIFTCVTLAVNTWYHASPCFGRRMLSRFVKEFYIFFHLPASFHQNYRTLFWKTRWNTGDKTKRWHFRVVSRILIGPSPSCSSEPSQDICKQIISY